MKRLKLPLKQREIDDLKIGEKLLLTGTLYTARDAAHKRLVEAGEKGDILPINLENSAIYYVGPSPKKPNQIIGSCGPTTSGRMDKYSPYLLDWGQKIMIGKGYRNRDVIEAIIRNKAVYLTAIGGAGALLSKSIKKADIIAYEDLGAEAIYKLEIQDFPCIVTIDSKGNDLYKSR